MMLLIKFDTTWNKISETALSLQEIERIIFEKTKRQCKFPPQERGCDFFSIAHQPMIGFFIISCREIPEGTVLCSYGGVYTSIEQYVYKYTSLAEQNYLLKHEENGNTLGILQARNGGGLGALLAHLPNPSQPSPFNELIDTNVCQTQNCRYEFNNGDAIFTATETIKSGTIIGFDYGVYYWDNCQTNPIYFNKNKLTPTPAHTVTKTPFVSFYDAATGFKLCITADNSAFLIMSTASVMSLLISEFTDHILDGSSKPNLATLNYGPFSFKINIREFSALIDNPKAPPLSFFGVHTKKHGCLPPPGSTYDEKMTQVPRPAPSH